jgi:branched-chain amino acid transport system ATP-binding protein
MVELRVESLTKRFGGVVALDGVSLTVERAERRAIIGPNGAGKSTLFSIISGDLAPTNGSVAIAGRRTTGLSPERVARLGVARTFQTSNLFGESSVLANVMLAALQSSGHAWDVARPFTRLGDCEQRARAALYVVGLAEKPGVSVAALSHGEARQLEIAAALVQRPSLLLLDEPLAGLASAERERIGRLLVELTREITVLLIEHDLDFAHTFADRMTVLNNGVVLADGTPQEVRDDPAVQAVYLGTGGAAAERAPRTNGASLLEVRGLSAGYGQALVLDGVSLEVGRGEVVAILGRNGMGKTTLLTSLMGFVRPRSGAVTLAGADLTRAAPLARARAGIALVPQGRRMLSGLTVAEELRLGARPGPWDLERVRTLFPTLRERERQQSETLSGGEQQMAAIGRALLRNPALLMMDEPSEGLSPALVRSLERTIQSLRDDGETVLLAEQNVDLALAVADRVYVLEHGRVVGHESAATLSMHRSRLERTLGL